MLHTTNADAAPSLASFDLLHAIAASKLYMHIFSSTPVLILRENQQTPVAAAVGLLLLYISPVLEECGIWGSDI